MIKGKIQLKGLFLSIDTYHVDKAQFIKNDIFYQLLPNDIVLYTVKDKLINVYKIIYRENITTVGILQKYDTYSNQYIFHTPLLSRNYICYIHPQYIKLKNIPLQYGDRFTIKIGRI